MKAYLWDRLGRPISTVDTGDPAPPSIVVPTVDVRFERIFWRCIGRTLFADDMYDMNAVDYEEGEESPRLSEHGAATP